MNVGQELKCLDWSVPPSSLLEHVQEAQRSRRALTSVMDLHPSTESILVLEGGPQIARTAAAATFSGDEDAQYEAYPDETLKGWSLEFAKAFSDLENTNTNASQLVGNALSILAVRQDHLWRSPYSSSWRGRPGLAGITNPHLSEVPRPFLINALVHESIHSALYCYELDEPFVRACQHRAVSMWTGASLRLDSLVHAVFVWCGLFHYWSSSPAIALDPDDQFRRRALLGFMKSPLRQIFEHRELLRDGLVDCLEGTVAGVLRRAQVIA